MRAGRAPGDAAARCTAAGIGEAGAAGRGRPRAAAGGRPGRVRRGAAGRRRARRRAVGGPLLTALAGGRRYLVDAAWQHTRDVAELAALFPDAHGSSTSCATCEARCARWPTRRWARRRRRAAPRCRRGCGRGWPSARRSSAGSSRWRPVTRSPRGIAAGRTLTHHPRGAAAQTRRRSSAAACEFLGEPTADRVHAPAEGAARAGRRRGRWATELDPELVGAGAGADPERLAPVPQPPRLVMVTDHFPKVSETFFVQQFLGLLDRGWDVHVVCQRSNKEHRAFFPELREQIERRTAGCTSPATTSTRRIAELRPDLVHFGYGVARLRPHAPARGARLPGRGQLPRLRPEQLPARQDPAPTTTSGGRPTWCTSSATSCGRGRSSAAARPTAPTRVITDAVDVARCAPPDRRDRRRRHRRPAAAAAQRRPAALEEGPRAGAGRGARSCVDRGIELELPDRRRRRAPRADASSPIADLGLDDHVELLGALRRGRGARPAGLGGRVHPPVADRGVRRRRGRGAGDGAAGGLLRRRRAAREHRRRRHRLRRAAPRRRRDGGGPAAARLPTPRCDADGAGRRAAGPSRSSTTASSSTRFEAVYRDAAGRAPHGRPPRLPLRQARAEPRVASSSARAASRSRRRRRAASCAEPSGGARSSSWCTATSSRELPAGARVLVVSRGDEDIVDFARHRGEHFPQAEDGRYAGHHPADSAEAIAHLEALREAGAEYLVIPALGVVARPLRGVRAPPRPATTGRSRAERRRLRRVRPRRPRRSRA